MVVGCGLLTTAALAVACSDDDVLVSAPGIGGDEASAGKSAGAGGDGGGSGGSGGSGGAECRNGLRVMAQFDSEKLPDGPFVRLLSWPAAHRIGVLSLESVAIYELASNGDVELVDEVDASDLGLVEPGWIISAAEYGDGLVATVRPETATDNASTLVRWMPDQEPERLLDLPAQFMRIEAATYGVGVAFAVGNGSIYLAQPDADQWSLSEASLRPGRRVRPLAFLDGSLLIGVNEIPRGEGGEGGAGGAGGGGAGEAGAGGGFGETYGRGARIELWSLTGSLLETHPTLGDPSVAIPTADGWLIGETNSFWGSYQAGIELLSESGELRTLSKVPVLSSGDGTDGAYDLALLGRRLLVANCESGLLSGDWSTTSTELERIEGPWDPDVFDCAPIALAVVDDVVAIAGDERVVFARTCD
jgi:hypothetical protein